MIFRTNTRQPDPDSDHRSASAMDSYGVPAVPILLAASVVHVLRRNPFDTATFLGTAVLILLDARRRRTAVVVLDPPRARWTEWLTVGIAAVGFGALIGPLDRGSAAVRVALAVAGVLAMAGILAGGERAPTGVRGRPPRRGWLPWAALAVAACLWELTQFLQQPDPQTGSTDHPTLSVLIEPLLAGGVTRAVVLAAWLAAGWWLVRAVLVAGRGAGGAAGAAGPGSAGGPGGEHR